MVGERPVILNKNKEVAATVIARSRENDLVLLQTKETSKGGIAIDQINTDTLLFKDLGKFLVSPQADTASVISVVGSLQISLPKVLSMGFLGASVAFRKGPPQLNFVRAGSPAANSDLQEGDEVVSINNVIIDKPESYGPALQQYWPGDTITISLKRAGNIYTKQIVLADRPIVIGTHPAEIFKGGKSLRRDGFQKVFMHDAVLMPNQCGGPLFDAEGRFQGINIARFSRVGTLALPAPVIFEFVKTATKQ
jgi:serine protease Do